MDRDVIHLRNMPGEPPKYIKKDCSEIKGETIDQKPLVITLNRTFPTWCEELKMNPHRRR